MTCKCDDNPNVSSCPPYANVNDVNALLGALCKECATTVPPGTDTSLFCAEFGGAMEECCEFLVVFEDENVYISNDCITWINLTAASEFEIGDIKPSARNSDNDNKWLLLDGRTIGSVASGATHRNNADTYVLFEHLWNKFTNTELIIETSGGAPTVRGVDAATDFAADKRMPLPDFRGRNISGMDNPGNGAGAANRVTSASADVLGGSVGAETHTLVKAELSDPLSANMPYVSTAYSVGASAFQLGAGLTGYTTIVNTGGNQPHNNMQPTIFMNYFMYTGN